jgi:hypothetical protein
MLNPRSGPPLEFVRIHFKSGDARALKRARTAAEANATIRELCRAAGIKKEVFLHSKIGNSMIEIYVPKESKEWTILNLRDKGLVVETTFDPTQRPEYAAADMAQTREFIVKRLTFLYKRARLVNLKSCILDGYNEDIRTAVTQAASQPAPANLAGATGTGGRQ